MLLEGSKDCAGLCTEQELSACLGPGGVAGVLCSSSGGGVPWVSTQPQAAWGQATQMPQHTVSSSLPPVYLPTTHEHADESSAKVHRRRKQMLRQGKAGPHCGAGSGG